MKKLGIVADNYKLKKFQELLKAEKITDYTVGPGTSPNTVTIGWVVEDSEFEEAKSKFMTICAQVEAEKKWLKGGK